ncbi:exodeoxyribonuclease III, partial [Aeromonas caviae]|nr:exodeoxyribonuclease III [Aeromonas caviae]
DLIMASDALQDKVTETGIDYGLRGIDKPSDHAPVWTCFA